MGLGVLGEENQPGGVRVDAVDDEDGGAGVRFDLGFQRGAAVGAAAGDDELARRLGNSQDAVGFEDDF